MEIALARVDDRLIHGQVVTAWLPTLGRCDEILICDDRAAGNPFVQQVLRMATPPGKAVRVLSVEETIVDFRQKANDARRVLLLARGPEPVLRLLEGGVHIQTLNVGGIGSGPGRRRLLKSLSLSETELDAFRKIQALGVRVELKMIPGERGTDLAGLEWT